MAKSQTSYQNNTNNTTPATVLPEDLVNAERQQTFKLAWDAYTGKLPKPLRVVRNKSDDNVRANPCRLVVSKTVAFLFGKEVSFQLDGDDEKTTPAEEYLNECWRTNRKMTLLQKVATNGAVYGHVFINIQVQPGQPYPRLINLDPTTVEVTTSPADVERVSEYKIQYQTDANHLYRKLIVASDTGTNWTITEQTKEIGIEGWQTIRITNWPYPWPPIVSCQNLTIPNEYWGQPDLSEDLIDLNKSMSFTLSNLARIIRFHAHPKQVASGMQSQSIKQAADETLIIPEGAKLDLLQIDPSSLQPSQDYYRLLKEAFHELAAVPEIATGKVENIGQLSALALAILYQPLIELTQVKRYTYGDMLDELNSRLLELGKQTLPIGSKPSVIWPELLPKDMVAERAALEMDQAMGVASKETIATKLGYNWELEQERMETEAEEAKANGLANVTPQGPVQAAPAPADQQPPEQDNLANANKEPHAN